jgi:hypothetical protein
MVAGLTHRRRPATISKPLAVTLLLLRLTNRQRTGPDPQPEVNLMSDKCHD